MSAKSWNCEGCTYLCHMIYNGKTNTYCRAFYENPELRNRTEWIGDEVVCLDYTIDPDAEDTQVRIWSRPMMKEVYGNEMH